MLFLNRISRFSIVVASALLTAHAQASEPTSFDCLIEPMVVTEVGSPVQGVIDRLLVDRGDSVQRGQPIVELESGTETVNLEYARVRASMSSEVDAREADLTLAKESLARIQVLHEKDLVPTQDLDKARAQRLIASAALVQALENLELTQIEATRAATVLDQKTIRSPIDGVVVEQQAFAGEFVYDNPLMTLAQLDPLRVEVVLPAHLFGSIKPGDVATVSPELDTGEPLVAQVQVIDRLLDTRSGTFGVRFTLPNPELTIPGGQKCRLEFSHGRTLVSIDE